MPVKKDSLNFGKMFFKDCTSAQAQQAAWNYGWLIDCLNTRRGGTVTFYQKIDGVYLFLSLNAYESAPFAKIEIAIAEYRMQNVSLGILPIARSVCRKRYSIWHNFNDETLNIKMDDNSIHLFISTKDFTVFQLSGLCDYIRRNMKKTLTLLKPALDDYRNYPPLEAEKQKVINSLNNGWPRRGEFKTRTSYLEEVIKIEPEEIGYFSASVWATYLEKPNLPKHKLSLQKLISRLQNSANEFLINDMSLSDSAEHWFNEGCVMQESIFFYKQVRCLEMALMNEKDAEKAKAIRGKIIGGLLNIHECRSSALLRQ